MIETFSDDFVISHDDGYSLVGSTTHIPLHKLSTKCIVKTMMPMPDLTSKLELSAIKDNTTISITYRMNQNLLLHFDEKTFYNGDVFEFSLNQFETYQIEHTTDLTGTSHRLKLQSFREMIATNLRILVAAIILLNNRQNTHSTPKFG